MFVVRTSARFDFTRITLRGGLGLLGLFFFFLMVLKSISARGTKSRLIFLAGVLLYLVYLTTVDLSRRNLMAIFVVLGIFVLFYVPRRRRFLALGGVTLLVAFVTLSPVMESVRFGLERAILTSVTEFEEGGGTVGVRLEGIAFNMQIFADTGYFGIGNRSDRLPSNDPYYYGREIFRYHAGDHGFFGVFYRYGVTGLLVSFFLIYGIFRDVRFVRRYGSVHHGDIASAIQLVMLHGIIGMGDMFWNEGHAAFYGLLFFILWRIRADTALWPRHPLPNWGGQPLR